MRKKLYKLLLIEDMEEDVFLIQRALRKGGLDADITSICTRQELRNLLAGNDWDAILSDYNLPRMNGLDALRIRRELSPDTPFIVVTGTIGEEAAIDLMKEGADDYLIKNNIKRLAASVRQAVKAARLRRGRRKAQVELVRTKTMLEGIADGVEDGLMLISPSHKILWTNRVMQKRLGADSGRLRGRFCHEVLFNRAAPCAPPDTVCPLREGASETDPAAIVSRNGQTYEVKALPLSFRADRAPNFIYVSRDITKLQESRAEVIRNLNRLQKLLRDTIEALTGTMELRDPYTAGHQKKVSRLATAIARKMHINQQTIEGIYMAGIVHDLGKMAVPTEILSKPSQLDPNEFEMIKTHSRVGYDILKKIDFPWPVPQAVLEHHERLDGSGYPAGLKENDICLEAKILAVADVVEAMAAHRPYRPAMGIDAALEEIEKNRGRLYDERAAQACLDLFRENNFIFDEGDDGNR